MNNIIKFNGKRSTINDKGFRFNKRKLILIDEEGIVKEHYFIVFENESSYKMQVVGYTKYLFDNLTNCSGETINYSAKIITSFLNYIFFECDERERITNIRYIKVKHGNDYLRDCSNGKIGKGKKTRKRIEDIETILNKFYIFLINECDDLIYINSNDIKFKYKRNGKKREQIMKSFFTIEYPTYIPPLRVKNLSTYFLSELLRACEYKYPEMKLAICLQAFGGLRRGEVCNVSKDKITISHQINGLNWFNIDLREKTQMREDKKDVGSIKKKRIQPIHPVFLPIISKIYSQHCELIKYINNPFGALFLNRNGEAMTESTYSDKFKELVNFVIKKMSQKGDFKSNSELNIMLSGKTNTHVLRHFFSKFIASLETTRNPVEIAYWRGDSSLDSALVYLINSPIIDEKIKEIQLEIYNGLNIGEKYGREV